MAGPDRFLDYPLAIDARGRTAETDGDGHVRDMIEQVLFTEPGERVNRPDFGCGLKQLVFMPNSDALVAATQQLVHGALLRWLSDVIAVDRVEVRGEESTIEVLVAYRRRATGEPREEVFRAPSGA